MKTTQHASIGLKGQIKVEVIDHLGNVVEERPWQKNLILDQGLNNLAEYQIAQIFEWAAAGTGTTRSTFEDVATSNTYTAAAGNRLNRMAGTRAFTAADIGKLVHVKSAGAGEAGEECMIVDVPADQTTTGPHAIVDGIGNLTTNISDWTLVTINLYGVDQVGLETEVAPRTNTYSAVVGHNSTTNTPSTGKRLLKRTFVFPPLAEDKDPMNGGGRYQMTDAVTVTKIEDGKAFLGTDVGKYLYFPELNKGAMITAIGGSNLATVSNSPAHGITVGYAGPIALYGGKKYGEVGFSHDGTVGNNLNIRVRLESGSGVSQTIPVLGPYPGTPSQQLRITYQLEVTVAPVAITASIPSGINDPNDALSTNKSGNAVIERLALSFINNDGSSNLTFTSLEPADASNAGLSPDNIPLATMGSGTTVDRGSGADNVELIAQPYTMGSFERFYEATFGINDAVGTWYVLGLFDVDSASFPFCFKFAAKQVKSAEVSLIVRFMKSWNRILT